MFNIQGRSTLLAQAYHIHKWTLWKEYYSIIKLSYAEEFFYIHKIISTGIWAIISSMKNFYNYKFGAFLWQNSINKSLDHTFQEPENKNEGLQLKQVADDNLILSK